MHWRRCSVRTVGPVSLVAALLVSAACQSGTSTRKQPDARPLTEGETIGKIERSAGGTAVIEGVRTLLSLDCVKGQLILKTNLEGIVATMDCAQQVPQSVLERFLGQPVAITYAGTRVRIENPTAGSLDLPARDATLTVTDATP